MSFFNLLQRFRVDICFLENFFRKVAEIVVFFFVIRNRYGAQTPLLYKNMVGTFYSVELPSVLFQNFHHLLCCHSHSIKLQYICCTLKSLCCCKAEDAKKSWLAAAIEDNIEIAEPESVDSYSGQFKLRLPKTLHKTLAEDSKKESVSMNQY